MISIRATVMQTPPPDALEVLPDQLIRVGHDGRIAEVRPATIGEDADVTLPEGSVLLPGLIDTHLHAPQWTQRGVGLDLPLEEWLNGYTFPLEASFAHTELAVEVWRAMVPAKSPLGCSTSSRLLNWRSLRKNVSLP